MKNQSRHLRNLKNEGVSDVLAQEIVKRKTCHYINDKSNGYDSCGDDEHTSKDKKKQKKKLYLKITCICK